jgi:hypothetical protein
MTGSGFSSSGCQNIVLIGDYSCPIISSSSTQLVCQIGSNSGLIPSIKYKVQIQIKNTGNALQNDWYSFSLIPKITSITPNIGLYFVKKKEKKMFSIV